MQNFEILIGSLYEENEIYKKKKNICKKDTDIVQLRLDFTTFVLLNPSDPETEKFVMGATDQDIIASSTIAGQCETDSFIVTSIDGVDRSPVLCGVNTGEHSKF